MFELRPLDNEQCTKLLMRVCKREGFELAKEHLSTVASLTKCQPRSALKALEGIMEYCQRESLKDGELEKLVPEIVAEIVPVPPYEAAAAWLNSVYNGKFSDAIIEIEKATDYDYFLRTLIENHRYVMYRQFGPKTHNLIKLDAKFVMKSLEAKNYAFDASHETMAAIIDQMITTYGRLKEYTIDAKSLLTVLTTRCVVLAKKDK
jgi:DNA polymerase III gamma/tau subunit